MLSLLLFIFIINAKEETCSVDDKSCVEDIPFNQKLATSTITLNDGTKIPIVGLGTWAASMTDRTHRYWESTELFSEDKQEFINTVSKQDLVQDNKEKEEFKNAVITAVKNGYRHIDSAVVYRTEDVVGEALKELYATTDIKREDLWITTKVPRDYRDMQQVRDGIDESLKLLNVEHIDLYLIHSPHSDEEEGKRGSDVLEIYKILLEYKETGKIKSVGVSNFGIQHLESIERNGYPLPSINQIEVNTFLVEQELIDYCNNKGIVIEAYCPIAQAHDIATHNKELLFIAKKYSKILNKKLTFAHVMIRWCIDKGFVVLPKSVTPKRIIANGDVFDFELDEEDMQRLEPLKKENYRICWNPLHEPWDV